MHADTVCVQREDTVEETSWINRTVDDSLPLKEKLLSGCWLDDDADDADNDDAYYL